MELSWQAREQFKEVLWAYYATHGRNELPWRLPDADGAFDPYKIMVSELMLQQTQVARVIPKYQAFLAQFPNVRTLAAAELGDVLRAWQGLGYNRRAKFLWQAAQQVVTDEAFPKTIEDLVRLPGIGVNTAGAITAYAYNQPVLFIETNVRTVYIHHFFADHTDIADKEIISLVGQTIARDQPREFYWALMDYGSYLKATVGNLNKASKQYAKQSRFEGSRRQIRGKIIKLLGDSPFTRNELLQALNDERAAQILDELSREGMIIERGGCYHL